MTDPYFYWKAALAGEKPKMFVDDPMCGFYRKGVYQRNEKGNNRRIGWAPVAVYLAGDPPIMIARVGGDVEVKGDRLNELWSYIADNPISEAEYRRVAERGLDWSDAHDPSRNKPTVVEAAADVFEEAQETKLAREITEAKAGVSQYEKIDSDEMAGRALSLKNTITSLAGDLNKHREALVRPHIDAQKTVNDRLNPIINVAKTQASMLLKAIGVWNDTKLAAARASEQSGQPANAPAPSTQIAAAVGRKASVKVAKIVTVIDIDKAFAYFRNEEWLYDALLKRSQGAVDAGLSLPWATTEERSIVR